MTPEEQKKTSKFLSLLLRHKPETIGLSLDEHGWAETQELLAKLRAAGFGLTLEELRLVVAHNDKQRFAFSEDQSRIRANQGHSLSVDLQLAEQTPPEILFHGTAEKNLSSIQVQGLIKGQRNHVHLSADPATARKVGQRYGKPVVLTIRSGQMHSQGRKFYLSKNGVWLTEAVSVQFIVFPG